MNINNGWGANLGMFIMPFLKMDLSLKNAYVQIDIKCKLSAR